MKASRKSVFALIGAMAMGAAMAAPNVEIVSVQQQYPWTNTVDIVYNVAGVASDTNGYFVAFTPTTQDGLPIEDINGETSIQVALSCTTNGAVAQWFPQTNQQYTACKMTPAVYRGGSAGGNDYMIVDLLTGAISYEPMATQEASNQRYNTQEYKTTKMVFRRVPKSSDYYIGEKDNTGLIGGGKNSGHTVSVDRDYYIGVFPVTEFQWGLIVNGVAPTSFAYGATCPKGSVSYNLIRGSALTAATPSTGICAALNKMTNRREGFDLPTETMWEIAARAGCSTVYLSGDDYDATALGAYALFNKKLNPVGGKKANNWGLFDVSGNVWEICRDCANSADLADLPPNGLAPITSGTTASTILRGGDAGQNTPSTWSRLSARNIEPKANSWYHVGLRLAFVGQE